MTILRHFAVLTDYFFWVAYPCQWWIFNGPPFRLDRSNQPEDLFADLILGGCISLAPQPQRN